MLKIPLFKIFTNKKNAHLSSLILILEENLRDSIIILFGLQMFAS